MEIHRTAEKQLQKPRTEFHFLFGITAVSSTHLDVYKRQGKGDAYANPLSDDDWQRLAKVKDLTPGEMRCV